MRKGFYTLSGIVRDRMGFDVCDGDAFIFVNRRLDSMKILHMETGGLVIYHMKLEACRFRLPEIETGDGATNRPTTWQELVLMVQGTSRTGGRHQMRWKSIRNEEKNIEK